MTKQQYYRFKHVSCVLLLLFSSMACAHDVTMLTVGTIDQPTIDGGQINEAPMPVTSTQDFTASLPFSDAWATHTNVNTILKTANQTGALKTVLEKSAERGLPASVAIIPMVESGYNPNAKSSKGAAGIWQLMEATAQEYGLTAEQRFSVPAATTAALSHLQHLYSQFHNWELAFAAYNAGSGRVQRALSQNPHAHSLHELDVPLETKQFVQRIKESIQLLEDKSCV